MKYEIHVSWSLGLALMLLGMPGCSGTKYKAMVDAGPERAEPESDRA